MTNVDDKKLIS